MNCFNHEGFVNRKYFTSLNGFRCICALAVIKEHAKLYLPGPRIINLGWLGVDLFFVISGFLIVTLLLRERDLRGGINLKSFYMRRTLRIFPVYYFLVLSVFLVYFVISPWKPDGFEFYKNTFPVLLLYAQNILVVSLGVFFHTWSLAMEEQFYLVWPTIEKYLCLRSRIFIVFIVFIVSEMCNFGVFNGWLDEVYEFSGAHLKPMFLITFTPIIVGVSLAYMLHDQRGYALLARFLRWRYSVLGITGLIVVVCEMAPESLQGWPKLIIHLLMGLLLASVVIREDHCVAGLLNQRWISYVGSISYGVYLYHTIVIGIIAGIYAKFGYPEQEAMLTFLLAVFFSIAIAHFSFQYLEKPFLRLKKQIWL